MFKKLFCKILWLFLTQKLGVLNTLATRALRISDDKSFEEEKSHLLNAIVENDYSRYLGQKAFLKATKNSLTRREPKERIRNVHLPFVQGTTDRIARILKKHNVPSTYPLTPFVSPSDQ